MVAGIVLFLWRWQFRQITKRVRNATRDDDQCKEQEVSSMSDSMVWLNDGKRELTRSGFKELVIWFKVQALHMSLCHKYWLQRINVAIC